METSHDARFSAFTPIQTQRFYQGERLKNKEAIAEVFTVGNSIIAHPLLVYVHKVNCEEIGGFPAKAAFAVSKKRIKKAVDRNLIKRYMRESYRLRKSNFYTHIQFPWQKRLVFVYIANRIESYTKIEKSMETLLTRINEKF